MPGVQTTHHLNKREAFVLVQDLIKAINEFRDGEVGENGDCVCMTQYGREAPRAFYKFHGSM